MKDRRPSIRLVSLAFAAAMWLAACSTSIDLHKRAVEGEIDGQEIGSRACGPGISDPLGEPVCGQLTALARTQLDREEPGHPAIRGFEVYRDPAFAGIAGTYWVIVVARLDDGTAAIYRMGCTVTSPEVGCRPKVTIQRKGASPPVGRP
jgi:hypothetical protein